MKVICSSRMAAVSLMFLIGISWASNAFGQDHTCRIRTRLSHLFVIFYDVYPDGNPGRLIWQGNLKAGQQIELNSEFGRFFYRYRIDPDAQSDVINGIIRFCRNGETLNLP